MNKYKQAGVEIFDRERIFSKHTFYILAGLFVAMFCAYAYLLASITINTAEAKQLDSAVKDTMSEIATLEVKYLNQVNSISMDRARELGLNEAPEISFVYTNPEAPSVALLR